ncbi:MAG: thioredoxin-dependent thiol peroxidase [Candidatus Hydrogenedentes bacterium]|nr:thioredoxin-dependent thiol peroxidase [Candidatus Hydrogenedentota bacterium]
MSLPAEGNSAPAISLKSADGEKVSLSKFKGKPVVLYFYPKDDTPGCTVEAKEFQANLKAFEKVGAKVIGISPDNEASHCKFADKFNLKFTLLCDEGHVVAEKYGLWVEKSMYGKKYMGVQRATFLIDGKGKIAKVWPKVKPEGHAEEVLAAVKAL